MNVLFNVEIEKTPPPAQQQVTLGFPWDSLEGRVWTAPEKAAEIPEENQQLAAN